MRRHWLCLSIVVALAVVLVAPSLAQAKDTYKIRNARGKVCGSVSTSNGMTWKVVNSHGARVGTLLSGSGAYCQMTHTPAAWEDGLMHEYADGSLLYSNSGESSGAATIGKAVRANGCWLLKTRKGRRYVKVGSAPLGCPDPMALCAARLLLWPHSLSLGTWPVKAAEGTYLGTIWSVENAGWGGDFFTDTGMGATIWYQGKGPASYLGEVSHEMSEDGPVASEWVVWDASWQDQHVIVARVSVDLFSVTNYFDGTTERLVRSATGPWSLQVLYQDQWIKVATIPRGCPGGWAAGAGMLLVSMVDV